MTIKIIPIREEKSVATNCTYRPGETRRFSPLVINAKTDFEAAAFKSSMIKEGYEDVHFPHVVGSLSCLFCQACVPLRIVVSEFKFSANQRRFLKRNADLDIKVRDSYLDTEEYELYLNHFMDRFSGQGTTPQNPETYLISKITHSHVQTIRNPHNSKLLGMLFFEDYGDGLYASSQIYDPAVSTERSLGHLGILKLVEYAQTLPRIRHIYLGSWVKNSDLLDYKQRYQPLEAKIGPGKEGWVRFDPSLHLQGYQPRPIRQLLVEFS